MNKACKIYVDAITKAGLWYSWESDELTDESFEESLRQVVLKISRNDRQSDSSRIARRALKEVAYLKMQDGSK